MKQTHVSYGLITALLLIVTSVALMVSKVINTMPVLGFLPWVVFLVGIIMNCAAFSKANNADITFGQAFASGMKATLIVSIVLAVWTVAADYVFPNMHAEQMELARQRMVEKGLSEELIEKSMKIADKFNSPAIKVIGSIIMGLIAGAIFSLIGGAVAKKNPRAAQIV